MSSRAAGGDGDEAAYEYPLLRPLDAFPAEVQGQPVLCLRDPLEFCDSVVYVAEQTAAILGLLDGRHSLLDIQAAFSRRFGTLLFREELLGVIRSLDEHCLLDSPHFAARRAAAVEEFRQATRRPAMLAGKSYAAEPDALRRQVDGYFVADGGPGDASPTPSAGRLAGLVVPHIDFARGGPCYAWGYRELQGAPPADRWIIFGTVHAPTPRPFVLTRKDFETPLGLVETDDDFLERLLIRTGTRYLEDEFAHRGEHSIEFQTVFLRHVTPPERRVRIVAVLCGSLAREQEPRSPAIAPEVEELLAAVRETMAASGGRTLVLASADLAHVGPRFGDPAPVTPGQLREIAAADRAMLDVVEKGDAAGFFQAVMRDGDRRRICGLPPIYALLDVLPGARGRLLRYSQWPDPAGTVTFAALALYG